MERVELLRNNTFCDEQCVKCGKWFSAGNVLPELFDKQDRFIGYLCDTCFDYHQESNLSACLGIVKV